MLKIVAENDIVSAVVVRFTGGGSWSTVMFAVRMMMSARAAGPESRHRARTVKAETAILLTPGIGNLL
jgi:hypothetical protein